jgi:MFS family permease
MISYLTALLLNNMTFHMLSTASGWIAYQKSGDPMSLALIGMMQFLPVLFSFIPSGYVSDRFDKRKVVAVTGIANTLISVCLAVWMSQEAAPMSFLYACVFMYSMTRSFEATSSATLLVEVVDFKVFTKSLARSSSVKQVAKVCGPLLAGFLLSLEKWPSLVFVIMSVAAFIASYAVMQTSKTSNAPKGRSAVLGQEMLMAGVKYIKGNKILLGAMGLDVFAGLLGGLAGILPIFAMEILHSDATALGWMRSSIAVGSFSASFVLGYLVLNRNIGKYLIYSVMALGLTVVTAAFAKQLPVICGILIVFGILDSLSVYIRQNLIQIASPSFVRGRVTAANQLFIVVSNQLSEVRAGVSSGLIGLIPTILVGGIGVIGLAASWRVLFPSLLALNSFEDVIPEESETPKVSAPSA